MSIVTVGTLPRTLTVLWHERGDHEYRRDTLTTVHRLTHRDVAGVLAIRYDLDTDVIRVDSVREVDL